MTDTPKPKLLIFGFSNVASGAGFAPPLTEKLAETHPQVEVDRVGLGALQIHIVPAFLREAMQAKGSVTHVLLEITSCAFSSHPAATEELGREFLLDCIHTVLEFGAQPILMLHYRNRQGKQVLDLNALTRQLCSDAGIKVIDLADALIDELGEAHVHRLLKDGAHTTPEGSALFAERVHQQLAPELENISETGSLPLPVWHRRTLPITELLPATDITDPTLHDLEVFGLTQTYLELAPQDTVTLPLGRTRQVLGLSFLFHDGGGLTQITCDSDDAAQTMATIDPFSYFPRIGIHALRFYSGRAVSALGIGPTVDAANVTLLKDHPKTDLRTLLGPVLVMEPSQQV